MSDLNNYFVAKIESKSVKPWLLKKHYARRMPTIQFAFGLFNKSGDSVISQMFGVADLKGVITFGPPAGRRAALACVPEEFTKYIFELNRLCINSDVPKNAASFFVSRALKMLPENSIILSYSDIGQGHIGYVYQATNWIYTGITDKTGCYSKIDVGEKVTKTGKSFWGKFGTSSKNVILEHYPDAIFFDRSQKHRYVFFTNKKHKKFLKYKIMAYPKGESKRYECKDIVNNMVK